MTAEPHQRPEMPRLEGQHPLDVGERERMLPIM
jgi:hypothetical protein